MKSAEYIARWEYTDTFAGEANYSWVRRGEVALPENATAQQITRLVKRDAGLTGVPMVRAEYGDSLEFRPGGIAAVLFVTIDYQ